MTSGHSPGKNPGPTAGTGAPPLQGIALAEGPSWGLLWRRDRAAGGSGEQKGDAGPTEEEALPRGDEEMAVNQR